MLQLGQGRTTGEHTGNESFQEFPRISKNSDNAASFPWSQCQGHCSVHLCLPYKCVISYQTTCALQRPAFVPLFHGTTYFRFFHSNLHKIPSNDVSAIKYHSFDMFLSMCRGLGTKKGQSLMNSDRDTHLYSSFCACTNVSFLINSDRATHLYSSFCAALSAPVQMYLS